MSDLFAAIGSSRVQALDVVVPNGGAWFADAILDEAVELTGATVVSLGSLRLHGTVDPTASGDFGSARSVRVVGGAGRWGTSLKPRDYHASSGVPALAVAQDAAREAGETLGTFAPAKARLGTDFVREAGAASTALEAALGGRPWWVDYAGVTHGGLRPAVEVAGEYGLLRYSAKTRKAILSVEEPAVIGIGSILKSERLAEPLTVRELAFRVQKSTFRVECWCGGGEGSRSRLGDALGTIVAGLRRQRLDGIYRYRVVSMAGAAADLQVVSKAAGLPNLLKVTQAGSGHTWVDLAQGKHVYVQFVAGDRSDPRITGADAEDGTSATRGAVRQNDATLTYLPVTPVAIMISNTPVPPGTPAPVMSGPAFLTFMYGTGHTPATPGAPGGHLAGNTVTASQRFRIAK